MFGEGLSISGLRPLKDLLNPDVRAQPAHPDFINILWCKSNNKTPKSQIEVQNYEKGRGSPQDFFPK